MHDLTIRQRSQALGLAALNGLAAATFSAFQDAPGAHLGVWAAVAAVTGLACLARALCGAGRLA